MKTLLAFFTLEDAGTVLFDMLARKYCWSISGQRGTGDGTGGSESYSVAKIKITVVE